MCSVLHELPGAGVRRDWTQARGASGPASECIDSPPRLAAGVREVDGIDSFLPSLLFLFFCSNRKSRDEVALSPHWGSDAGAIESVALFVPAWHIVLAAATWDALFGRK